MGIFDKSDQSGTLAKETTIISKSTKVTGELKLDSNLHVDGEIEGIINSSSVVSVGKSGVVDGEIYAQKVLVSGLVKGKIDAEHIEIVTGGRVVGEIVVDNLVIQNMGVFSGVCQQKENKIELEESKQLELKD